MKTEDFIRQCAKNRLSKMATAQALGVSKGKFDLMLTFMEPLPWVTTGRSIDAVRAAKARRHNYTAQLASVQHKAVAARRAQCLHTLPDGRSGSLEELLVQVGGTVTPSSVRRRLKKGWALQDALAKPRSSRYDQLKPYQRSAWI